MDLYIANATKQIIQFVYRVPEETGQRIQFIQIGRQVKLSGSLNPEQVQSIIAQHRPYGMVEAGEAARNKEFKGLCFSIDKPVRAPDIEKLVYSNNEVLEARGKQIREESGLASNRILEDSLQETGRDEILRNLHVEIEEVGAERNINEHYTMSRDADGPRTQSSKPIRQAARGRGRK